MEVVSKFFKRSLLASAIATVVIASGSAVAQAQTGGPVSTSAVSTQGTAADAIVRSYWTAERMAGAKPMERFVPNSQFAAQTSPGAGAMLGPPGRANGATPEMAQQHSPLVGRVTTFATPSVAQPQDFGSPPSDPLNGIYGPFQRWAQMGAYLQYPISTVGKLFFVIPPNQAGIAPGNYVCSGTAIDRSTVVTAGHCSAAGDATTWYNSWMFCPSYNDFGVNPNTGCWSVDTAWTTGPWFASGNPNYDYTCLVTHVTGTLKANKLGDVTGWAGRAWNWPTSMLEVSMGYPQAAPFDGNHIQVSAAPDWYSNSFGFATGGVGASKFMGNDMTGGSSGGPWILGYYNGHAGAEAPPVDSRGDTDPGSFWVNGVNSHKRCGAHCFTPPTASDGTFWDEMSSPRFTSTGGADINDSEALFSNCFANPNNN